MPVLGQTRELIGQVTKEAEGIGGLKAQIDKLEKGESYRKSRDRSSGNFS